MRGGWKYAAASVIGTSHQKSPEGVCQDSHAVGYLDAAEAFVGVVADGAGSASRAKIGSSRTCEIIMRELAGAPPCKLLTRALACDTLVAVRQALFEEADTEDLTVSDFASTMLVAIVTPDRGVFWQIGDGAICFREAEFEKYTYVYWPEKGDYSNVTFFVTDVRAQNEMEFDVIRRELVDVALFSDGIERLALDFTAGEAHSAFFSGLFPFMRSLPEGYSEELGAQIDSFLGSERVNKRTDDDKTLILASRSI